MGSISDGDYSIAEGYLTGTGTGDGEATLEKCMALEYGTLDTPGAYAHAEGTGTIA